MFVYWRVSIGVWLTNDGWLMTLAIYGDYHNPCIGNLIKQESFCRFLTRFLDAWFIKHRDHRWLSHVQPPRISPQQSPNVRRSLRNPHLDVSVSHLEGPQRAFYPGPEIHDFVFRIDVIVGNALYCWMWKKTNCRSSLNELLGSIAYRPVPKIATEHRWITYWVHGGYLQV